MGLNLTPYTEQRNRLPRTGTVILAQYNKDSVIVYQAYRPAIGLYAAKHKHFG